jgi:hypothetical protein
MDDFIRSRRRDCLDSFSSLAATRTRVWFRGLTPEQAIQTNRPDTGEHGINFIAINANISRQFEFMQNAKRAGHPRLSVVEARASPQPAPPRLRLSWNDPEMSKGEDLARR